MSFNRYLKEHEQQLWLGAMRCAERRVEALTICEEICVRQCDPNVIRHMHKEVIPPLPSEDNIFYFILFVYIFFNDYYVWEKHRRCSCSIYMRMHRTE